MVLRPGDPGGTGGTGGTGGSAETADRRSQVRRAVTASAVGTSIEWYDFFLYGTAAALIFPKLFFPESEPFIGVIESFATYAVGFAARPVGAAIFGHWGDRIGRKATLIVTLLLMGLSSAAIGLLPGTGTIGLAAPVLLVLLRILQGLAVGGEWGGSVLLAMEWGDQRKRGFMASWPQFGVPVGLLLGTGGMTAFSALLPPAAFESWGWRVPFLLSLVLVAIGLFIRLRILETPMFTKVVQSKQVERQPIPQVIRRYWREILLTAGLRYSEQMPFYIFTVFVLSYATEQGLARTFALGAVMVAAAISLFTVPFSGWLSDVVGRKRVYLTGSIIIGLYSFAYFAMLDTGVAAVAFIAIMLSLIPHDLQYGPQAALIAESFPTGLRYGGAGIGYQLSSVFAGGPAPLIAAFLVHTFGTAYAICVYVVFSVVVTVLCVRFLPDRSRADITDEATYERTGS
ncbi:MAG: MFS transporter [Streptosporangiales bacterium]|nr:MFS transporter [Streptosporangiales bacterium]